MLNTIPSSFISFIQIAIVGNVGLFLAGKKQGLEYMFSLLLSSEFRLRTNIAKFKNRIENLEYRILNSSVLFARNETEFHQSRVHLLRLVQALNREVKIRERAIYYFQASISLKPILKPLWLMSFFYSLYVMFIVLIAEQQKKTLNDIYVLQWVSIMLLIYFVISILIDLFSGHSKRAKKLIEIYYNTFGTVCLIGMMFSVIDMFKTIQLFWGNIPTVDLGESEYTIYIVLSFFCMIVYSVIVFLRNICFIIKKYYLFKEINSTLSKIEENMR